MANIQKYNDNVVDLLIIINEVLSIHGTATASSCDAEEERAQGQVGLPGCEGSP